MTLTPGPFSDGITLSGADLALSNPASVKGAGEAAALGIETKLATVPLVDMHTATSTALYSVPYGYQVMVTKVVLRKCSGNLTTASIDFGFAAANDWSLTATHTGLTDSTHQDIVLPKAGAMYGVYGVNGTFSVTVTITQGGAMTITIDVYGYLLPIGC